jgi:hypothetical protein
MTDSWTPSEGAVAIAVTAREIMIVDELSGERRTKMDFDLEWDLFVEATKIVTGLDGIVDALSHEEAWEKHFKDAIAATYSSEKEFSDALFQALRDSLGDFCHEPQPTPNTVQMSQNPKPIMLKGCNVGFDTQVYRNASLGFPDKYGISTDSMVDHACVLFGDQGATGGTTENSTKKRRISNSRGAETDDSQNAKSGKRFNDVTAAVELKHMYSSCANHDGRKTLDLRKAHHPIGQALLYSVDTWHCLRRGGQSADFIRVVVLAGRVAKQERTVELCCMQAHLQIPQFLGMPFEFQVDRCIPFLEGEESVQNDKQAIAIYLDTMTTGLYRAHDIAQRRRDSVDWPLSLCCSSPMQHLELIASPIPGAVSVEGIVINQGELFRCVNHDVLLHEWVAELGSWSRQKVVDSYCFVDRSYSMGNCLVKIAYRTVHNTMIPLEECYAALNSLARHLQSGDLADQKEGGDHRSETCGALVAFALISKLCLVTVMEDLSSRFGAILIADTAQECQWHWIAFDRLVREVFIPLADIRIVHTDIRCVPKSSTTGQSRIFNILVSGAGCETELRLIDYDSLVVLGTSLKTSKLKYAVSPSCLHDRVNRSSVEFLFWQVLWMAFVWCPASDDCLDVDMFCKNMFLPEAESEMTDSEYRALNSFKEWIGVASMESLKENWEYSKTDKKSLDRPVIADTLAILSEVFARNLP